MKTFIKNIKIYDGGSRGFFDGGLLIENDKIAAVLADGDAACDAEREIDGEGKCALPGFVDIHTHGRVGEDFNLADEDGMRRMAKSYAAVGTTSLMPTLASAPFEALLASAGAVSSLGGQTGGARFLGVHLEGRYLNVQKKGAHAAELLCPPDPTEIEPLLAAAGKPFRISAALELDEGGAFIAAAKEKGIMLSLAHTCATYDEAMRIAREGGASFTHLYNAMPPMHHRDGGPVLAAFDSRAYAELICDGLHVSPEMVAFTYRNAARGKLVLVTDSMAAAGAPDGIYDIAGTPAVVKNGIARTESGALAGSTLDMRAACENLARFADIPLCEAILCATETPAAAIGCAGKVGRLAAGAYADVLLANVNENKKTIDICRVFVGGRETK